MTYLISLYFDKESTEYLTGLMHRIESKTKNGAMHNIPPHITVGELRVSDQEEFLASSLKGIADAVTSFDIEIASVGLFKTKIVYLMPAPSEDLSWIVKKIPQLFDELIPKSSRYSSDTMIPHLTVAKHLTDIQQIEAVRFLQSENVYRKLRVEKIGLARVNPYDDVVTYMLN